MDIYQYAYLLGNILIAFPVWLIFFLRRKDLRREILILSIISGFLGPISELWYLRDYWQPQLFNGWSIGIEDYLFGFFAGGIAGSLYEEIFGRRYARRQNRKHHWPLFIFPILAIGTVITNLLIFVLSVNSIYATSLSFLIMAFIMLFFRRDLWVDSLFSGFLSGTIFFLAYMIFIPLFPDVIQRWWKLENISGVLIVGVPLEELWWGFTWGFVMGPMYEFFAGKKFKK